MKKTNKATTKSRSRSIRFPDSLWKALSKLRSDKYPTTSDVIRKILWANSDKVIE